MVKYLVDYCGMTDIAEAHQYAKSRGKIAIADYFQEKADLNRTLKM